MTLGRAPSATDSFSRAIWRLYCYQHSLYACPLYRSSFSIINNIFCFNQNHISMDAKIHQRRGYTRCDYRCALSMRRHTTMLHDEVNRLRWKSYLASTLLVWSFHAFPRRFTLPADYNYSRWRERVYHIQLNFQGIHWK